MTPGPLWHDDEQNIVKEVVMRKHVRRTPEFWRKHETRWRDSGLTQREYCSRHGLSLSSFQRWRGNLAGRRPSQSLEIVPVLSLAAPVEQLPMVPAAVTVAYGPYRVEVPPRFDRASLAAVLDLLGERQ